MRLPTEKTKPSNSLSDYSVLLYGASKIGKSTFCSHAEKALFLATEPGLNALDVFQTPIKNWTDLLNVCKELVTNKHNFKTIVIDTIDNAFQFCNDYICEKNDIGYPSELPYGKGFALVNNEFQRVLLKLAQMKQGLFLVSHSTEKEIDTRTGKYVKTVCTLPGKANKIVLGLVDIILYCTTETIKNKNDESVERRIFLSKPSKFYDAGDRTGRLSEVIDLDYATLVKEFNKNK